jgi:hypothetical protein
MERMRRPSHKEIQRSMDRVFEIQSAISLLGRRLEEISSIHNDDIDLQEILSFSRVTDLCASLLDDVAEMLERTMEES